MPHWQFILTFQMRKSLQTTTGENSPQISVFFFSFVTCSITYCAYQTFPMRHKGSNLFVFECEAYTGGKSYLSCRQKLLILFWCRSITPACPLMTSTYTNGRSYRRGCQETSMITDTTLSTITLSHNKRDSCGQARCSHSFLVTGLSTKDSSSTTFVSASNKCPVCFAAFVFSLRSTDFFLMFARYCAISGSFNIPKAWNLCKSMINLSMPRRPTQTRLSIRQKSCRGC